MTATVVDGKAVVATEPAISPLSTDEKPVHFKQFVRLLLDDESEVYGCVHCDFTDAAWTRVRSHLGIHGNGRRSGRPRKEPVLADSEVLALTLGELIERARQAEHRIDVVLQLQEDRDRWKARAKDAERRLNVLRTALGQTQ